MRETDDIYGGRFSGAGFKGCCMAIIDLERVEDIEAKVIEEYLKASFLFINIENDDEGVVKYD